jgi:hypothetical protein
MKGVVLEKSSRELGTNLECERISATVSFSCTSLSTTSKCHDRRHNSRPTPLAHDSIQASHVCGCKRSWRQARRGMEGTMIPSWVRGFIYCNRADRWADSGVLFSSMDLRMIAQELCFRYRWRAQISVQQVVAEGLWSNFAIYRQGVGLMPPVSLRMRIGKSTRTLSTKGG